MTKEKKRRSSQEREVILSLAILYLLIMGAVLALHYTHLGLGTPPPTTEKESAS